MTMLKRVSILLVIFTLLTTGADAYYDPYTGRFTQRDPAGDGGNWYAYTYNNPLRFIDPTGRVAVPPVIWFNPENDSFYLEDDGYIDFISADTLAAAYSAIWDLVPFLGDAKGWRDALAGEDLLTGESLSGLDRFLGLILLSEIRGVKKGLGFLRDLINAAGSTGKIWSKGKSGDVAQNAFEHFQKHGSEFDDVNNSVQYINKAHEFVNNPPSGALTKTRPNGDVLIYDPQTNTFGVKDVDGAPKTLFKPDKGINYWKRQ